MSLLILEKAQSMFVAHSAVLHCGAWLVRSTEVFFVGQNEGLDFNSGVTSSLSCSYFLFFFSFFFL